MRAALDALGMIPVVIDGKNKQTICTCTVSLKLENLSYQASSQYTQTRRPVGIELSCAIYARIDLNILFL